jgi:glucose/arabinose dehydrogenase
MTAVVQTRTRRHLSGLAALAVLPLVLAGTPAAAQPACAPDNAGITVPDGFCVVVVADSIGRARHLTVAPNGDVLVAVPGRESGGVMLLRDTDGDGVADVRRMVVDDRMAVDVQLGEYAGGPWLYYSTYREVVRFRWDAAAGAVAGPPDTVVSGLAGARQHGIKTFTLDDGRLFVNHGAPSNACQAEDRQAGSMGMDPCPLLDSTGGIWLYEAGTSGQRGADGERYATGLRNTVALTVRPADGELYGVVHGRDQLSQWGFSDTANAENPAEEFHRLVRGTDVGWPYCYHDPETDRKVLSPEYGGDGEMVGRCDRVAEPLIGFPAHWAPNGLHFYQGEQLPARYRGGAFIAFHGSWNRAPLPQQGFNVVFVPFTDDGAGDWSVFADGFREVGSRPNDVTEGPDGSLYVSDDRGGRVYRFVYQPGN